MPGGGASPPPPARTARAGLKQCMPGGGAAHPATHTRAGLEQCMPGPLPSLGPTSAVQFRGGGDLPPARDVLPPAGGTPQLGFALWLPGPVSAHVGERRWPRAMQRLTPPFFRLPSRPVTRRGRVAVGMVTRTLAFPAWMDHRESPSHKESRG
ncbi:unnamed protein product [Natator depressus]